MSFCPVSTTGWKQLNQTGLLRACEEHLVPMIDPASRRVFPKELFTVSAQIRRSGVAFDPSFQGLFSLGLTILFVEAAPTFAHTQVSLDETVAACALERWRLLHGAYPAALKDLTPDFLAKVPLDPVTAAQLKYHLAPDGRFTLYSVGWDCQDDGGKPVGGSPWLPWGSPPQNIYTGDWAWNYPKK